MRQSENELLAGMEGLKRGEPFPDELFYRIFEIEDLVERTQYLEAARNKARELKRIQEFNAVYKAFVVDYQQRMKQTGNQTSFTEQPIELECGAWMTSDQGIFTEKTDSKGFPVRITACSHPLLPVEILKNVDTGEERVSLAYFKYGEWQKVTVGRAVCADNASIVKVLSGIGVEVTSENAKYLVRYISDCIGMNPAKLSPKKSINRLGWSGSAFMPYAEDIVYDGDREFDAVFKNVREHGSFEAWKEHCAILRRDPIVRLAFAASAGSALIEPLNILPFVFHVWSGKSGTGKTVAVMAAMSIWGNPKMGGLVKTMNTTKVGIMRSAAFLYSLPYAGDELQTMKDRWASNFDQLIYQITEGIDRVRGRASGGVEDTKTWKNSFLFTGEESITKSNSRSGSKNRCIEVEAEGRLVEDGNRTVGILTENYGFAGRKIVAYLQATATATMREEYKGHFDEICRLGATEKQAMAMSCILVADRILTELIFPEEEPLREVDVEQYLKKASEVDVAEQSYQQVLNWIAKNPVRFQNPSAQDSANKGEVWGRIETDEKHPENASVAVINKDVLCEFLERTGFDYAAVSKDWAAKKRLLKNSQGKFVHQTKVYGIKASYIKILMQLAEDGDGFVSLEDMDIGQMELPF